MQNSAAIASTTITTKIDCTTAEVVCSPTDCALPCTRKPSRQPITAIRKAKIGAFAGVMAGFPPRMQYKAGLEWLMTGDPMSAQRAYEIGLVNRLAARGQALAVALEVAGRIAANAPLVVQAMKSIARRTLPASPTELYYPQQRLLQGIANSDDLREGVASFKEKRPPHFTGR